MNNPNNSINLSKTKEAMAWLVVFLGRTCSEKKLTRLQTERIPRTFNGRTSSSANEECKQSWNHEVTESCFAKKPQRDDVGWYLHCDTKLLKPREHMVSNERAKFLSTFQNQGESGDNFLLRVRGAAWYVNFLEKNIADAEDEIIQTKVIWGLRSADSKLKLLDK